MRLTSLRAFLQRISHEADKVVRREQTVSFELDGHLFSQARLLLRKGASVENKTGLSSWRAMMDEEIPVKIYECHDESQALFIKEISMNSPLVPYFPKCFMVINKYLVAEWVRGKQVTWEWASKDERLLNEIAKVQALMHGSEMETPQIAKCYYDEFLRRRLAKYKGVFPIDETIEEIYKTIDQGPLPEHAVIREGKICRTTAIVNRR